MSINFYENFKSYEIENTIENGVRCDVLKIKFADEYYPLEVSLFYRIYD